MIRAHELIWNVKEGRAQGLHMPDLLSIHVPALRRQLLFIPLTPVQWLS
jgi:hypothetical protein